MQRFILIIIAAHFMLAPLMGFSKRASMKCYIQSSFLINLGKFKEAEKVIDSYLESNGDDYAVMAEKAVVRKLMGGSFKEVRTILEKSRALSATYFRSTFLLASVMYDEYVKNPEQDQLLTEADKLAEKVLVQNPGFFEGLVLAGIIASDMKDDKRGLELLKEAARIDNSSYLVYYRIASCYHRMGKKDEELAALKKTLQLRKQNPEVLGRVSDILIENGKYGEAVDYLELLYKLIPKDRNVLYRYLYSLFLARETDKFLQKTDQHDIAGINPIVYARAIVQIGKNEFEKADKTLGMVNKRDEKYYLLKSDIALRMGKYLEAYNILSAMDVKYRKGSFNSLFIESMMGLSLHSRIIEYYSQLPQESRKVLGGNDLGNILLACSRRGNFNLALELVDSLYEKAEERQKHRIELLKKKMVSLKKREMPENLDCLGNVEAEILINFLKYNKDYDSAVKFMERRYSKCAAINTGLELSNLYWLAGRSSDAYRLLKAMLKKYPDVPAVLNSYAYTLAKDGKKLKKAKEFAEKALKKTDSDPAVMDTYGYILLKMGKLEAAAEYLEKAAAELPFDKEIKKHLGELYRKSGNKTKPDEADMKKKDRR